MTTLSFILQVERKLRIKYLFLSDVPYVAMANLPPTNNECYVCLEPYNTSSSWQLGGTLNRPVRLPCGHIIGIQCLTRWVLSDNFDNRCFLCRVKVIDMSRIPKRTDPSVSWALVTLGIIEVFKESISSARKERLLNTFKKLKWISPVGNKILTPDADRQMMLYEEFMEHLGKEQSAAQQRTIVQPVVVRRPTLLGQRGRDLLAGFALGLLLAFGLAVSTAHFNNAFRRHQEEMLSLRKQREAMETVTGVLLKSLCKQWEAMEPVTGVLLKSLCKQ